MYGKRLFRNRVLYFIYAPPLTRLDQASRDRPNPPYRGAPLEQCSVYYFWWAFLRENEGYWACCENGGTGEYSKLYADFGDVREDDFMRWWKRGARELFCEPTADGVIELEGPPEDWDDDNRLFLSVPITGDFDRIIEEIRASLRRARIIRREEYQKAKLKDDGFSKARYPVHTKPVLTSLYQTLTVWRAKKELGTSGTLVKVAMRAAQMMDVARGGDGTDVEPLATTTAHNCLTAAKNLIRNVGNGRFPDASPP